MSGEIVVQETPLVIQEMAGAEQVLVSPGAPQILEVGIPGPQGPPGGIAIGVSSLGNTLGQTGIRSTGTFVLRGGDNITLSQLTGTGGATVVFYGGAGGGGTGGGAYAAGVSTDGNSAGITGMAASRLVLVGGDNVTLSQDLVGANATVTVDVGQSTHSHSTGPGAISAGSQVQTSGTLVFVDANDVSFGLSESSLLTVSFSQSTHGHAQPASSEPPPVNNFGSVGTQVGSYALPDHVHPGVQQIGLSTQGNTAGDTRYGPQQVLLVGGDNITLSASTSPGLMTVTFQVQSQSTHSHVAPFVGGVSNLGNTSGNTGSRSDRVILAGGNNITLSASTDAGGQTITISGPSAGGGQTGISSIVAGTQTVTQGQVSFADSNGMAFGLSNSTLTASYTQSTHGHSDLSAGMTNVGNTSGDRFNLANGRLILAGGDNVTLFGSTNGSTATLTISAAAQTSEPRVVSAGVSNLGNTAGDTGLKSGSLVLRGGNNVTLSGSTDANGATVVFSGPNVGGAQTGISGIIAGTQTQTSGTLSFVDSNGFSFGLSQSSLLTASFSESTHAHSDLTAGMTNVGNTAGDRGLLANGRLVLAGGNNVTLSGSTDGSSMTIIVSAFNQSVQVETQTFVGGIAAGGATATSGTVQFSDGNGITFGLNGQTVTASVSTHAHSDLSAGITNVGNTDGDRFNLANGRLILAGGNNITLSGSTNGSTATLTISAPNQTAPVVSNAVQVVSTATGSGTNTSRFAADDHVHAGVNSVGISNLGNTVGTSGAGPGRLVLAGGNNITLSQGTDATGSTVTINARSMASPATTEPAPVNNFGSVGDVSQRYAFEDHIHPGVQQIGISTQGNTAGSTRYGAQQVLWVGGNNVTLSMSTSPGLATITVVGPTTVPIGAAAPKTVSTVASTGTITRYSPEDHQHVGVNSVGISNVGNTSGTSGAGPGRLILAGGNNITLSQATDATGSTITVSAANETQTVPPIATANAKVVSTIGSTGTITRFAPEDHQHIGVNSIGISTIGNTSGTSGVGPGRLVLAGGNNITLSQATDATGSTLTISAPNLGAGAGYTAGISNIGNTSGTSSMASNQMVFAGGNNITVSESYSAGSATITISGPNLPSPPTISLWDNLSPVGADNALTHVPVGAGTLLIAPLTPGPTGLFPGNMTVQTMFLDMSFSSSIASARTYTFQFGLYTINGTSTLSLLNSASFSTNFASNAATSLYSGNRWVSFVSSQFSTDFTLSQGSYYMAFNILTTSASGGMSYHGQRLGRSITRLGTFGSGQNASNTGQGWVPFAGILSATTNAMPASIHASNISQIFTASAQQAALIPHVNLQALASAF